MDNSYEIVCRIIDDNQTCISGNDIKKLQEIKNKLVENPTAEETDKILAKLAEYYKTKLINLDFIKALNMHGEFKNLKKIEMYKNLPLVDPKSIELYNSLIAIPEDYDNIVKYFNGVFNLTERYGKKVYSKNDRSIIMNFVCENNKKLICRPQKYNTLEEEMKNYTNALMKQYNLDYMDFKNCEKEHARLMGKRFAYTNIQEKYLDRKLNNIAQLYLFSCLSKENNAILVSRDCGHGFGYDIYTTANIDNTVKELLIEVKVTDDDEEIELTDTEYQTMVYSLTSSKVEYYICLSKINIINGFTFENKILRAKGITCFEDVNSNNKYYLDFHKHGACFKLAEENEKQKKITL